MIMTKKEYKAAFFDLVFDISNEEATNINFFKFQSTLKLVSTIIRNNEVRELNKVLRQHFPQYYKSPFNIKSIHQKSNNENKK